MAIHIVPYTPAYADDWDVFITDCPMATFIQTRRFLSYHKDRFIDSSLLFFDGEKLIGVLPAAEATEQSVVSHPGITYGGILHQGDLAGEKMEQALAAASAHYRERDFSSLVYKPAPACFRRRPCDDDIYSLCQMGAALTAGKLLTVINLADRGKVSKARKKGQKKALGAGLKIVDGAEYLPAVWRLVEQNLRTRYGVKPLHSYEEIKHLTELFPDNIRCYAGMLEEKVACGAVLFLFPTVWHVQYGHANDIGRSIYALDAFYEELIAQASAGGIRYFSFGTSNENDPKTGKVRLNNSLYSSKIQFGGGGEMVIEFTLPL